MLVGWGGVLSAAVLIGAAATALQLTGLAAAIKILNPPARPTKIERD